MDCNENCCECGKDCLKADMIDKLVDAGILQKNENAAKK